jgi:hypothetical protein
MSDKQRSSKQDKDLKRKIKEFEDQKRADAMGKVQEIIIVVPAGEESKISFDQWWMIVNKKVGLKSWMKEIVKADFKGRSLTSEETMEKFNWALNQFGYKI